MFSQRNLAKRSSWSCEVLPHILAEVEWIVSKRKQTLISEKLRRLTDSDPLGRFVGQPPNSTQPKVLVPGAPIDALHQLEKELQGKRVTDALLDNRTGGLYLGFEEDVEFRVFNFTGYEVWEIHFPDGTGEYSPYAK